MNDIRPEWSNKRHIYVWEFPDRYRYVLFIGWSELDSIIYDFPSHSPAFEYALDASRAGLNDFEGIKEIHKKQIKKVLYYHPYWCLGQDQKHLEGYLVIGPEITIAEEILRRSRSEAEKFIRSVGFPYQKMIVFADAVGFEFRDNTGLTISRVSLEYEACEPLNDEHASACQRVEELLKRRNYERTS